MKRLEPKKAMQTKQVVSPRFLCLVRHGEAAPQNIGLDDFERPLTNKGVKNCAKVAEAIIRQLPHFDLLLSSPADRALETAHLFAAHWQHPVQRIQIVPQFYAGKNLPDLVVQLIKGYQSIAIFGHNPSFNSLAAFFLTGFTDNIPKGAAVGIAFEATTRNLLSKSTGQLKFFITPKAVSARTVLLRT